MVKSMTGFGCASGIVEGVEFTVEVKSVNNRFIKVSMRLPDMLSSLETKIESLVRSNLTRGSVSISVRMKIPDEQAVHSVNSVALESYINQLKPLEVEANPMFRLDLAALLQLPGVCNPPELDNLAEKTSTGLCELAETALAGLVEMRKVEGKSVVADLTKNATLISENLEFIKERSPEVTKHYHDKLKARVDELLTAANLNIDEESLAREVAIFADRSDIAEEISRLTQHLKEFDKMCNSDDPIGRKMDFIAQEMLREANTIASKGSDAQIARAVVDIKTSIDRIKEQAANIE